MSEAEKYFSRKYVADGDWNLNTNWYYRVYLIIIPRGFFVSLLGNFWMRSVVNRPNSVQIESMMQQSIYQNEMNN